MRTTRTKTMGLTLAAALLTSLPTGAMAQATETVRLTGDRVALYNVAGEVRVEPGSGSEIVVEVTRGGAEADRLRVERVEEEGRQAVRVVYPSTSVVYPRMGRRSNTNSTSDRFFDGDRVEVRGSGDGVEAWADVTVRVPAGRDLNVYLLVGTIEAEGVSGDLFLETGSGDISATSIAGRLAIDTGSGHVVVRDVDGETDVDTGSGSIQVEGVLGGSIRLDTGSGEVTGNGLEAPSIVVDTGSGRVELDDVASSDVVIDTGSGSVALGMLTDVERLEVDTGSGSITVRLPASAGAEVEMDTGSGSLDLELSLEVRTVRRDHIEGRLGDGRGTIELDTGSGTIRLLGR